MIPILVGDSVPTLDGQFSSGRSPEWLGFSPKLGKLLDMSPRAVLYFSVESAS